MAGTLWLGFEVKCGPKTLKCTLIKIVSKETNIGDILAENVDADCGVIETVNGYTSRPMAADNSICRFYCKY